MSTARDMLTASLRKIGAIAPGESLESGEATDALAELNRMISSWSTEGLLIYTPTRETLVMTPGTAAYTMGTTGTFSATRAQRILEVLIRDASNTPAQEYKCEELNLEQWTNIPSRDSQSPIPTKFYADAGFPRETVTLYPVPSAAHTLVIYSEKPLSSFASLDTEVSLPPGYEHSIIHNLSLHLAPEYGKAAPQEIVAIATETKASLKRMNRKTPVLQLEPALLPSGSRGGYDIFRGDS
jgi:hypothetical protein